MKSRWGILGLVGLTLFVVGGIAVFWWVQVGRLRTPPVVPTATRTRTAAASSPTTARASPTATCSATSQPTRTPAPSSTARPTSTAVPVASQTPSPPPPPTASPSDTAVPRPSATATRAAVAAPVIRQPAEGETVHGDRFAVALDWPGELAADEYFDLWLWLPDQSPHSVQLTRDRESRIWPPGWVGEYRLMVRVVQTHSTSPGAMLPRSPFSAVRTFQYGGLGVETPVPPPEPTLAPPPVPTLTPYPFPWPYPYPWPGPSPYPYPQP